MKKVLVLFVVLLCCIGLSGCHHEPDPELLPSTSTTVSTLNNLTSTTAPTTAPVSTNKGAAQNSLSVTIYQVSVNAFDSFMEQRSSEVFRAEPRYCYPQDGDRYETWNVTLMEINEDFADFVSNGLAQYLQENGVDGEIVQYAVYEAFDIPITIWAKTTESEAFVTVNEQPLDASYTYRYYTTSAYEERFRRREAQLYVFEEAVPTNTTVLMNESYAVLPLMTVLKEFGATVTPSADDEYAVDFLDRQYTLNMKKLTFCEKVEEAFDLFWMTGAVLIYKEHDELMVDCNVLRVLMSDIGCPVDIVCDVQDNTVRITKRSYD